MWDEVFYDCWFLTTISWKKEIVARRSERSRSRERVYPCSSLLAGRQQQSVVPPPLGIQQNQATQSEDENSATVDPQNLVSDHWRSRKKQKIRKFTEKRCRSERRCELSEEGEEKSKSGGNLKLNRLSMSLSRTQICKWLLCDSLMCGVIHLNAGRQTDLNALSSSSLQKQEDTETAFTDTGRKEEYCRKAAECTAKGQEVQAHGFKWRRWRTWKWTWNLFKFSDCCTSTTSSSRTSCQFTRTTSQIARTSCKC